MADTWFWSDQHAGHANIIRFFNKDGASRLRGPFWSDDGSEKGFCDIETMARTMADKFNATVHKGDTVYWLGDVAWSLQWLERFMGMLTVEADNFLVRGNHDDLHLDEYLKYFRDVRGEYDFGSEARNRFILSHYPLHPRSLGVKYGAAVNVHGHTHARQLTKFGWLNDGTTPFNFGDQLDKRYYNVSVECTNYGLVHISQIRNRVAEVIDEAGATCPQYAATVAALTGK